MAKKKPIQMYVQGEPVPVDELTDEENDQYSTVVLGVIGALGIIVIYLLLKTFFSLKVI